MSNFCRLKKATGKTTRISNLIIFVISKNNENGLIKKPRLMEMDLILREIKKCHDLFQMLDHFQYVSDVCEKNMKRSLLDCLAG